MQWFKSIDPKLQAAVVAGTVALTTALITATSTAINIWLKAFLDSRAGGRADKKARRDTYRKYADPLTTAAESLFWRLHEIYTTDRGDYLHRGRGRTRYEQHKASSTRYRIAALLGWMVALKRELVSVSAYPDPTVQPLRDAIVSVQTSLAEGTHVERSSAEALADLWGITCLDVARAGWAINATIKGFLHEQGAQAVSDLTAGDGEALLQQVADHLSRYGSEPVSASAIAASRDEALQVIARREAWLYRDWQDAIGDWMLINGDGIRRFDVKGYRVFADAERKQKPADSEWLRRLAELTDDLDVRQDEWADARIAQLRGVYHAVAQLMVRFHEAADDLSSVSPAAIAQARSLMAQTAAT